MKVELTGIYSIFSKLMESLIKDHIMNYLTTYNLISPYTNSVFCKKDPVLHNYCM